MANDCKAFLGCKPGAKWHVVGDSADGHFPRDLVQMVYKENENLIRKYVGGAELYSEPSTESKRQIIALGLLDPKQVMDFPVTLQQLALQAGEDPDPSSMWWRFARRAVDLYSQLPQLETVLVRAEVSDTFAFARQGADAVFSNKCVVFLLDEWWSFSILQSRIHEFWARLTSSTQGEGLSYVPSYTFNTFPFPNDLLSYQSLEAIGRSYYEFRAASMLQNNEGLTKIYNRFHDPDVRDPDILKLRELHAAMDRAVLDAYGWTAIPTACEFFLDYEIDDEEWGNKKKPWRYRWPDDVRDEVLIRLLELNAKRAKEEELSGAAAANKAAKREAKRAGKKAAPKRTPKKSGMENLFR
jgi:hypothetical protein